MIKKFYLLPLLAVVLMMVSCEEVKEATKFDNWGPRNDAYMDSLAAVYDAKTDPALQRFVPMTNAKVFIYYKDITPSTNVVVDQQPLYTQGVSVYYRGYYIFGESFDQNFTGANPDPEFDAPTTFMVTGVVSGWTEVLQRMKKGQRWMVYLPYEMAYGASGSGAIPGYSTLIFDMELIDIVTD